MSARDDKYNGSAKGRARSKRYRGTVKARNAQRNRVLRVSGLRCGRCNGWQDHTWGCLRPYERDYRRAARARARKAAA